MKLSGREIYFEFHKLTLPRGSDLLETDNVCVVTTPSNPNFYDGNYILFKGAVSEDAAFFADAARTKFPDAGHSAIHFECDAAHLTDGFEALGFEASHVSLNKWENNDSRVVGEGFKIREISMYELESYTQIQCEARDHDTSYLAESIRAERDSENFHHIGLFQGTNMVGALCLICGELGVLIENVSVTERLRGQGLGSMMIHGLMTLELVKGKSKYIIAEKGGDPERLYQRLGFRHICDDISFLKVF